MNQLAQLPSGSSRRQRGLTLLELMVSITIGLVILLALGTVYLGTTSTNRQMTSVSRMSEDAAIAFNLVGGNLRMAGYSTPRYKVLPGQALVGGVAKTTPNRNFVGAAIRGCDHGFINPKADFVDLACQPTGTQPAAIALRFEGDLPTKLDPPPIFNTVPIKGKDKDGKDQFYSSDCLNRAVTAILPDIINGPGYTLIDSRFIIQPRSDDSVLELKCSGNGDAFNSPQPMVEFVENIQLAYGITSDAESHQALYYGSAATVDALPGAVDDRWSRVVSIRICMVLRSQAYDQAGAGNYIDCDGNSVASPGGLMRRSFTSVYALRNRSTIQMPAT